LSPCRDKQASRFDLNCPMKRDRAKAIENRGCSIAESANMLGLDTFTVHSLIQRRKLSADVTHCGELVIPRKEVQRVLGADSAIPEIGGKEK
jgi:hypothetical protein